MTFNFSAGIRLVCSVSVSPTLVALSSAYFLPTITVPGPSCCSVASLPCFQPWW